MDLKGWCCAMSNREKVIELLDKVPDYKIDYVIAYIQGLTADEIPNQDTRDAFAEIDEMKQNGNGQHFSGTTEEFFKMLEN